MTAHEQTAAEYLTACLSLCMGEGYTCHCEATGEGVRLWAYSDGMLWRKDVDIAMWVGRARWVGLMGMVEEAASEMGWGW